MTDPTSIRDLDLPKGRPAKAVWNVDREWREEFIYFLLVDRFHDGSDRDHAEGVERSSGYGTGAALSTWCGGNLRGVTRNLDYIKGLGCTAIWLSPIFETLGNEGDYHGYGISNYLAVDPRFGTKADLRALVDAAHDRGMRVFLDVVLNHAADVWSYPDDREYNYWNDVQFPFGEWRHTDRPLPTELRDPDLYHRRGRIRNWDAPLETLHGDFYGLKGFDNDDTASGLRLLEILIQTHCYWMRELDIDGFRLDAVKHIGELAIARFCTAIREYAKRLGKLHFFLFGELVAGSDAINRYTGPNTPSDTSNTVYFGMDSVLDFQLHWSLPDTIKGLRDPGDLIRRYEDLKGHALTRGELGRYLVTFLDNHDQIGQDWKRRFGAGATEDQVIAGVAYLLFALGTACIYYGTEQGLSGQGDGDRFVRECLFDSESNKDLLNPSSRIYTEIAAVAKICNAVRAVRYGRMYWREVSGNAVDFGLPTSHPCTLAFSRVLACDEVLFAFNTSTNMARADYVIVDSTTKGATMKYLYGGTGSVPVQQHANGSRYVRVPLDPGRFAVLADEWV